MSSPHPHDAFFRDVFSDPKNLAALVRSILPASAAARLDFERLTVCPERYVDETLRAFETDLLAQVPLVEGSDEATEAFTDGISAETQKAIASVGPARMEETVMTLAQQWRAEGEANGRVEGERALLRALIVHKFGVIPRSVEAALETADEPSLSVWAERIFSARSAEDVVA